MSAGAGPTLLDALRLALRPGAARDEAERRTALVTRSAVAAAVGQGAGVAASLLVVPLTLGALGPERFGAWTALLSLLAWFRVADLGVGNGLVGPLAAATARGDDEPARRWVASAAALLLGVAALAALLLAAAWRAIDWPAALGVAGEAGRAELRPAVGLAFLLFALELPLSALDKVFGAVREGVAWNGWTLAGHAASLVAVAVAMAAGGGLAALVGAWSGARLAVVLLSAGWLLVRRPALRFGAADVDVGLARTLSRSGGWFFLIQIAALVLYSTDNLVIAGVLGAEAVTPYAVAWRLFTIPSLGMAVAFPFLWPAYAEALAAGDRAWAVRALRSSVVRSAVAGALLTLPLLAFGQEVIRAWAGPAAVPSRTLLLWMGAWSFLLSWMNAVACFLNAAGRLRVQALSGLAAAAANVLLSIAWAGRYGVEGVIAATVVVTCVAIVPFSVAATWQTVRRLRPS